MNIKNNESYQRTHQLIQMTYLELIEDSYEVNVTALCQYANINRSTFYYHFEDIIDLYHSLKADIFKELKNAFLVEGENNEFLNYQIYLIFTQHLYKYRQFYRVFLDENSKQFPIIDGYTDLKEHIITPRLRNQGVTDPQEIDLRFICFQAGLTHTVKYWFDTGLTQSPEVVAHVLNETIRI